MGTREYGFEWTAAPICLIYKKKDEAKCQNYRQCTFQYTIKRSGCIHKRKFNKENGRITRRGIKAASESWEVMWIKLAR